MKAGAALDKIESKGKGSLKSVYLSYLIISYLVGVNTDVQVFLSPLLSLSLSLSLSINFMVKIKR